MCFRAPKDICYGPIAPGQFFIDRLNPDTPLTYEITAELIQGVFICQTWSMNQNQDGWIFSPDKWGGGVQIAMCNLERMERVSKLKARHASEQDLRQRDDKWRATYDNTREPIRVVRCTCGVGDFEPRERHATHCFCRGEFS